MAIKYRYGSGVLRHIVSPKKENEKASLVITPSRTMPRSRLVEQDDKGIDKLSG